MGEVWDQVGYAVSEYTLVFQQTTGRERDLRRWVLVRPARRRTDTSPHRDATPFTVDFTGMIAVPICSALAMEPGAYERFLLTSGIVRELEALMSRVALSDSASVEVARKEIQSLIMAAEVQHIVDRMSA